MYVFVLIAIVACVVGIAVENYRWPQDRTALHARFIRADTTPEKLGLLVGLVLNHSVVRWLIAFATASTVVLSILMVPACQRAIRNAVDAGALSPTLLYVLVGLAVSALMVLLSVAARRIAA
jgi:hypothetical protein